LRHDKFHAAVKGMWENTKEQEKTQKKTSSFRVSPMKCLLRIMSSDIGDIGLLHS